MKFDYQTKRKLLLAVLAILALNTMSFTSSYLSQFMTIQVPVLGTVQNLIGILGAILAVMMLNRQV